MSLTNLGSTLRRSAAVLESAKDLPGVVDARRLVERGRFVRGWVPDGVWGVYDSFEEAQQAVPAGKRSGYDHPEMASYYRDKLHGPHIRDYPVLYWLKDIVATSRRLFDFGGHIGVSYFAFRRYLRLPEGFEWRVCDVGAVVREGQKLAAERKETGLVFTTDTRELDGADTLLAAGSLAYLPEGSLHSMLESVERRPRHVFVHYTPLHESRSYVTVQATGFAFCPYTVAHRASFVEGMRRLGYEVVDEWLHERALEVPFEPWTRVPHYRGIYFRGA